MARIEDSKQYVLIPKYEDGIELRTRGLFGSDLRKSFNEDILNDCLENGKTLIYKGNEYFLDEKI